MIPNRRRILWAGFRPVGVHRNHIFHIIPYPLSCRVGIYTNRAAYITEWITDGLSTKWARNHTIATAMSIRVCPMVYRKPIYSTSHILSVLSYLFSALQDRAISHTIYQPGGLSYGWDTRRAVYELNLKPPNSYPEGNPIGRISARRNLSEANLLYLPNPINPINPILPIRYPTGYGAIQSDIITEISKELTPKPHDTNQAEYHMGGILRQCYLS